MEFKIKGRTYEYESDFPDGWQFAKGDAFKFPVVIGPEKCFIKRFEKHTEHISGWKLLQSLTGRTHDTLAKVYGTSHELEDNKIAHYVLFEFAEGQTLHNRVLEKAQMNLAKFTNDLFIAIQILQNNGHWFPDFCEKNIFCGDHGYYLLIDLDSTYPTSALPNNDMRGSKDYWMLVLNFHKEILNHPAILPAQFNGASFNYLHVVFLILRLKIYYSIEEMEYESAELFRQLPHYLNGISPLFGKLFNKVYQSSETPLTSYEIDEIKTVVLNEITSLSSRQIREKIMNKPAVNKLPVINTFAATNYIEHTGDKYTIASDQNFDLTWDVEQATEVKLYRNEAVYKTFDNQQKNTAFTEHVYDGISKKITYTLVAINGAAKAEKSVIAEIVFKKEAIAAADINTPPTKEDVVDYLVPDNLKINNFSVEDYVEKRANEYTVESGQPFTLQWNVENAEKKELYKNGKLYRQLNSNENTVTVREMVYDGEAKRIEYTLNISSNKTLLKLTEVASLTVKVLYKQPVIAFAINNYTKKNEDHYVVESGKAFTLFWTVNNAHTLKILKNEQELKQLNGDATSLETAAGNKEENKQQLTYTLVAFAADDLETGRKSLHVLVKPKPKPPAPKPDPRKPLMYYIVCIGAALIILFAILYFLFGRSRQSSANTIIDSVSTRRMDGKELVIIHGKHFPENRIATDIFLNEMRAFILAYSKEDSIVAKYPYTFTTPAGTNTVLLRVVVNNDTIYKQYIKRVEQAANTNTSGKDADDTHKKMDTLVSAGKKLDTMIKTLESTILKKK